MSAELRMLSAMLALSGVADCTGQRYGEHRELYAMPDRQPLPADGYRWTDIARLTRKMDLMKHKDVQRTICYVYRQTSRQPDIYRQTGFAR